ncbi:MAG: thioesterase family protein, partial [Negativicutes bacterium]
MEIMEKITVGACREETMTVGVQHTAQALGSGSLPVLGTPAMTALMEKAATNLAQELLPEGWTSVGTALNIEHLAATPVG